MKLKKLSEYENIKGFSKIESALIKENYLDPKKFLEDFPDYNKTIILDSFLENMKVLKNTDLFIDFIEKNKNKKFCILGDYDTDGILSTVIMLIGLRKLGIDVDFVIPNRLKDGYGLKKEIIDLAIKKKAEVLITVDNGIGGKKEIEYAKSKNLEVFITDHHLPGDSSVPENVIIVNPKYNKDEFSDICGGFVAFKLIYSLLKTKKINNPNLFRELAFFAAVATKADMMPVLNENRELLISVFNYCNYLKERNLWFGRVLKVIKGLGGRFVLNDPNRKIDENLFSFNISPTINAVSRIEGDVSGLVNDLYNCETNSSALNRYSYINEKRKKYTNLLLEKIEVKKSDFQIEIFNVADFDFPIKGLLGIVSNKLTKEQNKKITMTGILNNGFYNFSCRSSNEYSFYDLVFNKLQKENPDLKISGGGHDSALGLTFSAEEGNLEKFIEFLEKDLKENTKETKETLFQLEPELLDEIFYTYDKFRVFGNNFEKLNFFYEGAFIDYNKKEKEIQIGDYKFKTFKKIEKSDFLNKNIKVKFIINMDLKDGPYFKIEKFIDSKERI